MQTDPIHGNGPFERLSHGRIDPQSLEDKPGRSEQDHLNDSRAQSSAMLLRLYDSSSPE